LSADISNVPTAKKTTKVTVDLNQSTNKISMKKKQDATIVVTSILLPVPYSSTQKGLRKYRSAAHIPTLSSSSFIVHIYI